MLKSYARSRTRRTLRCMEWRSRILDDDQVICRIPDRMKLDVLKTASIGTSPRSP